MAFQKGVITKILKRKTDGDLSSLLVEFDVYDSAGEKEHNAIDLREDFLSKLTGTATDKKAAIKAKIRECMIIAHSNLARKISPPSATPVDTIEEVEPSSELGSNEIT